MLVHAPIAAYTFIHLLSWHYSYLEVGQTITLDYRCQVNVGLGSYKSFSAGNLCSKIELLHESHMLPYFVTSVMLKCQKNTCVHMKWPSVLLVCVDKLYFQRLTEMLHEITPFSKYRIPLLLFLKQFYDL